MGKRLCEIVLTLIALFSSGCLEDTSFRDYHREQVRKSREAWKNKDYSLKTKEKIVDGFFNALGQKIKGDIKKANEKAEKEYRTPRLTGTETKKLDEIIVDKDFQLYCRLKTGERYPSLIEKVKTNMGLRLDDTEKLILVYTRQKEATNEDWQWAYASRTRPLETELISAKKRKDFGMFMFDIGEIKEIAPDFFSYIVLKMNGTSKTFKKIFEADKKAKQRYDRQVNSFERNNPLWRYFFNGLNTAQNGFLSLAHPTMISREDKEAFELVKNKDFQAYYLKKNQDLSLLFNEELMDRFRRLGPIYSIESKHPEWALAYDYFQSRSIKK